MALGYASPRRLLAELTASEIGEWRAFFTLEPWGCHEDWKRAASICAAVVNSQRVRGHAVPAKDFIPDYRPDSIKRLDDHKAALYAIAAAARSRGELKVVKRDH